MDYQIIDENKLRTFMKLSYDEKFTEICKEMRANREAFPEKHPYKKFGLYIGGILWEKGDTIVTGLDGLPYIIKK
jgi:hypothetical protein